MFSTGRTSHVPSNSGQWVRWRPSNIRRTGKDGIDTDATNEIDGAQRFRRLVSGQLIERDPFESAGCQTTGE